MARILVIDDDPDMREMMRQMLEQAGYEVDEADNGKAGLKQYRNQPADLVVTDIIMPEQEGLETILRFRKYFPNLKIIAISGGDRAGTTDFLPMAKQAGAVMTFEKPLDRREFLKAVAECLSGE